MSHSINSDGLFQVVPRVQDGGPGPGSRGSPTGESLGPVHPDEPQHSPSLKLTTDGPFAFDRHGPDPSGRAGSTAEIARAVGGSGDDWVPMVREPAPAHPARPSPENGSELVAPCGAGSPQEVRPSEPDPIPRGEI